MSLLSSSPPPYPAFHPGEEIFMGLYSWLPCPLALLALSNGKTWQKIRRKEAGASAISPLLPSSGPNLTVTVFSLEVMDPLVRFRWLCSNLALGVGLSPCCDQPHTDASLCLVSWLDPLTPLENSSSLSLPQVALCVCVIDLHLARTLTDSPVLLDGSRPLAHGKMVENSL